NTLLVLYRNSANAYPLLPPTRYNCGQPNLIIKVMAAATRSNLDYAMIAATFTFWPLGKIVTHLPYPSAQERLYSLQSTLYIKRTGSVFDKLAPTSSRSSRSNLREGLQGFRDSYVTSVTQKTPSEEGAQGKQDSGLLEKGRAVHI
ncbi:hypothetical protein COCON_G00205480, partial [Conger conger]